MKLYRVTCRGMTSAHGTAYVVADNPDAAYKKLRKHLDTKELGFRKERELNKVELIADASDYPDCKTQLFL